VLGQGFRHNHDGVSHGRDPQTRLSSDLDLNQPATAHPRTLRILSLLERLPSVSSSHLKTYKTASGKPNSGQTRRLVKRIQSRHQNQPTSLSSTSWSLQS
jgi:hypothetical protein